MLHAFKEYYSRNSKYRLASPNKIHTVLPGQLLKLHICVSVFVPWHVFPPAEGEGLLQVLDLVLVPLRQDTVHVFQLFQSFHMPSAVT